MSSREAQQQMMRRFQPELAFFERILNLSSTDADAFPRIATDSSVPSWDDGVELAAVSSHPLCRENPSSTFSASPIAHRPSAGLGIVCPDSSTKRHGGVCYPCQIVLTLVKLPAQCPPPTTPHGCAWIAPALDSSRSVRGGSPAAPPLSPFLDSGQAGEALDQSFLIKSVSLALFGCLFPSSLPSPSPSPHQPSQGLRPFPSFSPRRPAVSSFLPRRLALPRHHLLSSSPAGQVFWISKTHHSFLRL